MSNGIPMTNIEMIIDNSGLRISATYVIANTIPIMINNNCATNCNNIIPLSNEVETEKLYTYVAIKMMSAKTPNRLLIRIDKIGVTLTSASFNRFNKINT